MAQTMVNFRMDEELKRNMEKACSDMGLTLTAAFTIFAKKVAREKRIPFEVSAEPFYFENNRKYLTLDKVAGTQYLSIGFDSDKNYNYPKTFLVGDIRKLTIGKPNRVLCVLSKNIKDIKYEQIVYIAKNVDIEKLKCNKEIQEKLS